MKQHNWVKLTEYNGYLGWNVFYQCTECSACGGPAGPGMPGEIPWLPFIADGSGVQLSLDCNEAQEQIMNHSSFKNKTRK